MTRFPFLFAGIFAAFALGWFTLILLPKWQIGHLPPQVEEETGEIYPVNTGGIFDQGRQVYIENGCFYCHSQQIRDPHNSADLDRRWGLRRTVARDYIYETPALLGNIRNGPDLASVGTRLKDPAWHYRHLYNPRLMNRESMMPPFRFLFSTQKIVGERAFDALELTGRDAPPAGYEVVPTSKARALVGYLLSLDKSHALKEVKELRTAEEVAAK